MLGVNDCLLVGYAFEADGGLRLGVAGNPRTLHTHVLPEAADEVVRLFGQTLGHVSGEIPRNALCTCRGPVVNGRWPLTPADQDAAVTAELAATLCPACGTETRVVARDPLTEVVEVACEAPDCDWTEVG